MLIIDVVGSSDEEKMTHECGMFKVYGKFSKGGNSYNEDLSFSIGDVT